MSQVRIISNLSNVAEKMKIEKFGISKILYSTSAANLDFEVLQNYLKFEVKKKNKL